MPLLPAHRGEGVTAITSPGLDMSWTASTRLSGQCRALLAFVRRFFSPRTLDRMRTRQLPLRASSPGRCTVLRAFQKIGSRSSRGGSGSRRLQAGSSHESINALEETHGDMVLPPTHAEFVVEV